MTENHTQEDVEQASEELVEQLVSEHMGWASSIARSVARAWNMDWQLDGLDGGAYEALLFCARRYDPERGVPFKSYARRRIHEAATEEARKSRSWQKRVGANTESDQVAREISARLFEVYPELRDGVLPDVEGETLEKARDSIRQLLVSASLFASSPLVGTDSPDQALEYRELFRLLANLEPIHQQILWSVYWEGYSMRSIATDWDIDELAVIREHQELLNFLSGILDEDRIGKKKLKVRPVLRKLALRQKDLFAEGKFSTLTPGFVVVMLLSFMASALLILVNLIRYLGN